MSGNVSVSCRTCAREVWTSTDKVDREGNVACDDCFFEQVGDMLTADELRRADLRKPDNLLTAIEWLNESWGGRA